MRRLEKKERGILKRIEKKKEKKGRPGGCDSIGVSTLNSLDQKAIDILSNK